MPPNKDSLVLGRVTVHSDGDQVSITCHFRDNSSPSERCVVVSREATESVLMVEYFPMGTDFPVKLSLSESGNYSVAVFGWSEGTIESFPADVQQVDIIRGILVLLFLHACIAGIAVSCKSVCYRFFCLFADTSTQATPSSNSEPQLNLLPIVVSCVVGGTLFALVVVILAAVVVSIHQRKKLRRVANTSSHDPCTQSNPAYELHKPRKKTIPMKQNIAYEQRTPSSRPSSIFV